MSNIPRYSSIGSDLAGGSMQLMKAGKTDVTQTIEAVAGCGNAILALLQLLRIPGRDVQDRYQASCTNFVFTVESRATRQIRTTHIRIIDSVIEAVLKPA